MAEAADTKPVRVLVADREWRLLPRDASAARVAEVLGATMGPSGTDCSPIGDAELFADRVSTRHRSVAGLLQASPPDDPAPLSLPDLDGSPEALASGLMWVSSALAEATAGRVNASPAVGLYHAALASLHGQGILLAAPGGTGKSTASARLPAPWRSWSDDTAYLADDGCGGWWAHPWPTWSRALTGQALGSWPVGERVPLRAICFLEQAPTDSITPVGRGEAAVRIYAAAEQARALTLRAAPAELAQARRARWFDGAVALSAAVPSYVLRLTLDGRFWELIESTLG